MPTIITVAPGPKLRPGEVAIWERHADHPDGEIFVAEGNAPIQLARTPLVSERMSKGRLVEVEQSAVPVILAPAVASEPESPAQPPADPLAAPGLLTDAQRQALEEAGIATADDVRAVDDDALASVDGIGPATIARLREAAKE